MDCTGVSLDSFYCISIIEILFCLRKVSNVIQTNLSRRKIVTLTDGNATIEVKLWGRKLMPVYKRDLVFPYHVSMLMSTKGKRV